jgi:hypothetical protein
MLSLLSMVKFSMCGNICSFDVFSRPFLGPSLFGNVRCLSDMKKARELLGLRKSIDRLQDARMHMPLSSILATDLHMMKPLHALAPWIMTFRCVWNEVTMKLEGFYILIGPCCSLHCVLLVFEHQNGRAHSVHMPTSDFWFLGLPCLAAGLTRSRVLERLSCGSYRSSMF